MKLALVSLDWDAVDLIESLPQLDFIGIIDPSPDGCCDIPYLGSDDSWEMLKQAQHDLKVILAVDPPSIKARLVKHYGQEALITIQSKDAYVSSRAKIGLGALIQRGVKIMPQVTIGPYCKINVQATIHHESSIGQCCTIAPGAQVLGNVIIEDFVYVGAGVVIKQKCKIGRGAVIGAGAVVVRDVPPHVTVAGVPAKELKKTFIKT
ncbi:MAG: hypothetical protein Q8L98_06755 [Chlamydiales bacterium]|nr:hypothetical protein [Chlamydiales bacterium]